LFAVDGDRRRVGVSAGAVCAVRQVVMNRDPLKTIAPCLFCNYEEFEGAFRRQDRASGSFRLSDIAPDLGVPKGHQACFCDNDFVTIQPYLQNLPRDYPIRVLSAALAYRLWRSGGLLPLRGR
jgi:hypothetical protein